MNQINNDITKLVASKIKNNENKKIILKSLNKLLNGHYIKYDLETNIFGKNLTPDLSDNTFNKILSTLNEKTDRRKSKGVYYTPNDVSRYIILNSFINNCIPNNNKMFNDQKSIIQLLSLNKNEIRKLVFDKTILDPTCGTGEFLINSFNIKCELISKIKTINDEDILNIIKTIYGNDVDDESVDISKIRLFFLAAAKLENPDSLPLLAKILVNQFFEYDFILNFESIRQKFDLILGNPPYIEYSRFDKKEKLKNKFGNVYADVIKNSIDLLNDDGTLGFIIPLSYVATPRMQPIREYVELNSGKQFILNFADRPDSLFTSVHQKLNILIAQKNKEQHKIFTSSYKHWYKVEREKLFDSLQVFQSQKKINTFIPKVGNKIEHSIFEKIYTDTKLNILDNQDSSGKEFYLNLRATFWIKAFSFNPGSREYKSFKYSEDKYDFIICLLNSSLFWFYWTVISDCWHITNKELKHFFIPDKIKDQKTFTKLRLELEEKLEQTKQFIGSKQTAYEYKHRLCKNPIDQIDELLASVYKLTKKEVEYIKAYETNYRSGEMNK